MRVRRLAASAANRSRARRRDRGSHVIKSLSKSSYPCDPGHFLPNPIFSKQKMGHALRSSGMARALNRAALSVSDCRYCRGEPAAISIVVIVVARRTR